MAAVLDCLLLVRFFTLQVTLIAVITSTESGRSVKEKARDSLYSQV